MRSFLKDTLAAAMVLAVLLSFSAPSISGEKGDKVPVLYIEEKIVDMGLIYEEKDVEHEFVVENRGNAELHILRIKAG